MERYEALPEPVRAQMENRFMWAVHEGAVHPEATVEKAVATIIEPLLDHQRGAVGPMREERIARARGLAQAIAECRDDARLDGIREGAAEIAELLRGR